ncbi:MAG: adenylate/guanylate cyclase domain-containing protein, partial [Bacteroidetes bacterium]|nr:adenylate/guanylate cyclase domain-containing protein [Bacteroidota bacterium]
MAYIPKFSHIGEEIHYSLFMPTNQLSAIMFTDIVGYTSMMQQDRERAMRAVKLHESTLKAKISQYEGELLQTYGDGSLSIFNSASAAIQ